MLLLLPQVRSSLASMVHAGGRGQEDRADSALEELDWCLEQVDKKEMGAGEQQEDQQEM